MRTLLASVLLAVGLLWAAPAFAAVDINSADASELESLPGIGPSKAAAIVQYRTENGPFKSVDELDNVPGIGASTLASLRDQVTLGKGGAAGGGEKAASAGATAGASTKEPAPSSGGACSVNINAADASALQNLPGIGASKAAAIVQHRTDNGPFASCDALDDVSGIGPSTVAGLKDCCTVK
jgi:competence protein ComEA